MVRNSKDPDRSADVTDLDTGGSDYGVAKAGTQNAQTYWNEAICGTLAWGINTFSFEAFDEPWKPHAVGDTGSSGDETHWGVMNADRSTKFPLTCS